MNGDEVATGDCENFTASGTLLFFCFLMLHGRFAVMAFQHSYICKCLSVSRPAGRMIIRQHFRVKFETSHQLLFPTNPIIRDSSQRSHPSFTRSSITARQCRRVRKSCVSYASMGNKPASTLLPRG
jgi:hypothetical protein